MLKRLIKAAFGAGARRPHRIWTGAFGGLTLHLDAANSMQVILGLYERETYRDLRKLTLGVGTAIDIGAAQGEFSIYFLATVRAQNVLAFEPHPENREAFQENLKSNGLDSDPRLKIVRKYLGRVEDENWTTLDSFAAELREPVFMKMDVDGGEVEVLLGAKRLLGLPKVRLLIETHSAELEAGCVRILEESGISTKIIRNGWWRRIIKDQRPIAHNRWLIGYRSSDIRF